MAGDTKLRGGHRETAAKVSRYAERSQREFVAEVYAGAKAGRSYGADVMRTYQSFGGPK